MGLPTPRINIFFTGESKLSGILMIKEQKQGA
jgi:hypothetical protein